MSILAGIDYDTSLEEKKEVLECFGYAANVYRDDETAASMEGNRLQELMTPEGQAVTVDRYDVRLLFENATHFRDALPFPSSPYRGGKADPPEVEAERFQDLEFSTAFCGPDASQGTPFETPPPVPPPNDQQQIDVEAYRDMNFPDFVEQHCVIEKVAQTIRQEGDRLEFRLKLKPELAPHFPFLNVDHPLHLYYCYLKKTGLRLSDYAPEATPRFLKDLLATPPGPEPAPSSSSSSSSSSTTTTKGATGAPGGAARRSSPPPPNRGPSPPADSPGRAKKPRLAEPAPDSAPVAASRKSKSGLGDLLGGYGGDDSDDDEEEADGDEEEHQTAGGGDEEMPPAGQELGPGGGDVQMTVGGGEGEGGTQADEEAAAAASAEEILKEQRRKRALRFLREKKLMEGP